MAMILLTLIFNRDSCDIKHARGDGAKFFTRK